MLYVVGVIAALLLVGLIGGCAVVQPKYTLYKAGITKRVKVEEARAARDSATQYAEAEVIRARGVARANEIIANSITPEYLRYFYIQNLAEVQAAGGTVIYIPTEAGLPILEAGRTAGK